MSSYTPKRSDFDSDERFVWNRWRMSNSISGNDAFPIRIRAAEFLPGNPRIMTFALTGDGQVYEERTRVSVQETTIAPHPASVTRLTDSQIQHMTRRFLQWRLPADFSPDGGISFSRMFNGHMNLPLENRPVGTNLLNATQAEEMVRYMLDGLPQ